jgi:hypothetical protein
LRRAVVTQQTSIDQKSAEPRIASTTSRNALVERGDEADALERRC